MLGSLPPCANTLHSPISKFKKIILIKLISLNSKGGSNFIIYINSMKLEFDITIFGKFKFLGDAFKLHYKPSVFT